MSSYLITGARAPVALELARNLNKTFNKVFLADSFYYPIARNSCAVEQYFRVPSPRYNFVGYKKSLVNIIKTKKINYLIPICEEVFYISKIKKELEEFCVVFCSDFDLINSMHSKFNIIEMAKDIRINLPESILITNNKIIKKKSFQDLVIKAEYSRFGTNVLLSPSKKEVIYLTDRYKGSFVMQSLIKGKELCSYSISKNGALCLHVTYEPIYRVKKSAGVYFKQIIDEEITCFVKDFVSKYSFTGQIGFDFIRNNEGAYLIECNPRATSGLHLVSEINLAKSIEKNNKSIDVLAKKPSMIGIVVLFVCFPISLFKLKFKKIFSDYFLARDVVNDGSDKSFLLYGFISFAELLFIALTKKISIRAASTKDIEWDGQEE